jgi:hypothetical protein
VKEREGLGYGEAIDNLSRKRACCVIHWRSRFCIFCLIIIGKCKQKLEKVSVINHYLGLTTTQVVCLPGLIVYGKQFDFLEPLLKTVDHFLGLLMQFVVRIPF